VFAHIREVQCASHFPLRATGPGRAADARGLSGAQYSRDEMSGYPEGSQRNATVRPPAAFLDLVISDGYVGVVAVHATMTAHPAGTVLSLRHDVDHVVAAGSSRAEHVAEDGGESKTLPMPNGKVLPKPASAVLLVPSANAKSKMPPVAVASAPLPMVAGR
jgi:hypothetical protein